MPEAKSLDMCPQCGCRAVSHEGPEERRFTCGETVSVTNEGGGSRYRAAYRCRTIPGRIRHLEAALRQAADAVVDRRSISHVQFKVMHLMRASGVPVRPAIPMSAIRALEQRGMIRHTGRGLYELTEWGHEVFARLQKETERYDAYAV